MDRNALLATTRAEFMRCFLDAFDACLPRSRNALFDAADASFQASEQRRLLASFKLLTERHADLRHQLMSAMDQLLNRSFQTTYSTFRPSFSSNYSGDIGLSLVDANQYEDQLHINKVTSRFRHTAEEELRDLNIRIAILFEQDTINERENPFRPFLFVRAIATAVDNMGQLIENNQPLFDQLATDIEPAIAAIYGAVNRHLSDNGIAAQLQLKIQKTASAKAAPNNGEEYPDQGIEATGDDHASDAARSVSAPLDNSQRVLSSDRPKRRVEQLVDMVKRFSRSGHFADGNSGQDNSDNSEGDGAAVKFSSDEASDIAHYRYRNSDGSGNGNGSKAHLATDWVGSNGMADTLRQFFSSSSIHSPLASNPEQYREQLLRQRPISERLGASLDALIAASVPAGERMSSGDGSIRNLIFEQRSLLSEASGDSKEQMTIDVVAMLFEFILRDNQIPAEVRAQLGRLQFLVLKVALRESTLLTQKTHPARLLVNRIGSISIGLQQIDPGGARIASEIIRIVETLLADRSESSGLFDTMLDEFDAFIARELRARDVNVDRAAQVVENAEGRTLRFARLAAQLGEVLTGLSIDPYLHDFLTGTWVHVIERAERAQGTVSRRFRQLVPDLLWSIVPKNSPAERSRLITLLPVIVGTVRQGLAMDGWDEDRQHQLLDWLVATHSRSLRSNDAAIADLTLSAMNEHFENFLTNLEQAQLSYVAPDEGMSAMHGTFLAEAIDESAMAVDMLDPLVDTAHTLPMQFAEDVEPSPQPDAAQNSFSEQTDALERLRNGVAIEITFGTEPILASLSWKSATTLVLTLEGKTAPSMISVRMFLRLYTMQRAKFVESAPLFERAINALLTSADEVEKLAA